METETGAEAMEVVEEEEEQLPPPLLVAEGVLEKGEEEGSVLAGEVQKEGEAGGVKTADHKLLSSECLDDPNFAIICSFLENFGQHIRLGEFPFDDLQMMLENTTEVPEPLVKLHIALLRRVFKTITVDKWERSLAKFGHTYCNQDGWEIERFGYKKAKLPTKLRILKNLLESQFDYNVKFKAEVNKLEAGHLRLIPLGRDCEGQVYWYQVDNDANLRVYREDVDDETWEIVASNREEFCELIEKLQKGDVKRPEIEAIIVDEDSNEKEIETKEIILDTGKVDDNVEDSESSDSEEELFEKVATHEKIPPLVDVKISSDPKLPSATPLSASSENDGVIKTENRLEESESVPIKEEQSDTTSGATELAINSDATTCEVADNKITDKSLPDTNEANARGKQNLLASSCVESIPPVEEKVIVKTEIVGVQKTFPKLHQPYQDIPENKIDLVDSRKTDEESSSLNKETPSTHSTLLKIEEQIIKEEDVLDKNKIKSDVQAASDSSSLSEALQKSSAWVCGSQKTKEPVLETFKATKTWVCGKEAEKSASETKTEPMQTKVIPLISEKPSRKDEQSALRTDSESTNLAKVCPTVKPDLDSMEVDDSSSPLKLETTENVIMQESLVTASTTEKDRDDNSLESNEGELQIAETTSSHFSLTTSSEASKPDKFEEKLATEDSGKVSVASETQDGNAQSSVTSKTSGAQENVDEAKSQQASNIPHVPDSEKKDTNDSNRELVRDAAIVSNCDIEPRDTNNTEAVSGASRTESNLTEAEKFPELTSSQNTMNIEEADPTATASLDDSKICLDASSTVEPPVEPVLTVAAVNTISLGVQDVQEDAIPCDDSESTEEKNDLPEKLLEVASASQVLFSSTPEVTPTRSPFSMSMILEPRRIPDEGHSPVSTPQESAIKPSDSDTSVNYSKIPVSVNKSDSGSQPTENPREETTSCSSPVTEISASAKVECTSAVTGEDLKNQLTVDISEPESSVTEDSTEPKPSTDLNLPLPEGSQKNSVDHDKAECKSTEDVKIDSALASDCEENSKAQSVVLEKNPELTAAPIIPTPVPTVSNSPIKESKSTTSSLLGLVSYDSSSDEEESTSDNVAKVTESSPLGAVSESVLKRRADEEVNVPVKVPKLEEKSKSVLNPIIGEAVEEEVMHIIGEGSGAMNEGGNDEVLTSQRSQTLSSQDEPDSSNDDSQESLEVQKPRKRGRPGKSGKRGRKPGTKMGAQSKTPKERKPRSSTGSRGNREIARLGVPVETLETNGNGEGANEKPVRASRRIAQIRMKEEEERRKLEEERLAQLKADQIRKQEKKQEGEKVVSASGGTPKTKKSKKTSETVGNYLPSPSASDSDSGGDDGDEFQVAKIKKSKKKKRRANGKQSLKPGNKPWQTSSSEEDSEAVEEEEEYHYEEEEHLVFNESDHEFSPESDLGEDGEAHPSRHARTAKRGEKEVEEETGCMKCSKGDHPEWILLCDKCDQGWHASCLRPQLWVIPEGEWFCPPCQHNMLVTKLSVNLVEYDKLLKRRENDILRKQRLAFVNVSLNNVLPEKTEEEKATEAHEIKKKKEKEKTSRRRRILSDEELSDTFINDRSGDDEHTENSEEDSDDGPIYRLRARRAAKTFDYKEYDDMINSALRASDDEGGEEQADIASAAENGEINGDGDEPKGEAEAEESQSSIPIEEEKHSGKNEAYEKYLEQQEEEFDSDDELMDEKERLRRKAAKSKGGSKRKKRSFRDLEDYTDEDNSDEDFKGSEAEDDEELDEDAVEEDESEWSGDHEESDDSLARRSRATAKGKKVKYGRREEYLDVGAVRRSTRARRKARVSYDESDQDDDDEPEEKWQSGESEEEETPSESDDETYGKKKKKKAPPPRSAVPRFFLGAIGKETKKAPKKKKRKVDEDDVDRAWSSSQGSKAKKKAAEEQVERRTRGRKINFKDILDSGESDDDGNIRPKRRRISSGEEDDEAESSRRLAEEIKAANQREAAMYAAMQKQNSNTSTSKSTAPSTSVLASVLSATIEPPTLLKSVASDASVLGMKEQPPVLSQESSSSSPLELLSNSTMSLGGTLPLSSDPVGGKVDPGPPMLKPEKGISSAILEMTLSKPVPAPPIPPALAKALGRIKSSSIPPAGPGAAVSPKSHSTHPSESPLPAHPPVVPMTSSLTPVIPPMSSTPSVTVSSSPSKHSRSSGASSSSPSGTTSTGSSKKKEKASKAPPSASPPTAPSSTPPATITSPLRSMTPPMQQALSALSAQGLPQGIPIDIARVPNPTLYQGNPAMRPFHPMWVRNSAPPPYGVGGGPPTSIGKPPPLNSGPFMAHAAQRPGFPSQPPPLRIPNPNPSPLQAFQHFKRDQIPSHMFRMPPGQQPGGLPGILAAGLMGQQGPPDSRFFGGPNPYAPYGILPPHTQSQPLQSMFGIPPFEFRPGEAFGKDDPRGAPPPAGTSSPPVSQPLPPSTGSSGPKDDGPPPPPSSQTESEFGGLVSYFSSQRSEEDMDS